MDVQVNGDEITGTVEVGLGCTHCTTEFATQTFDFNFTVDCCAEPVLIVELEEVDALTGTTELRRRQVNTYGASIRVAVHCDACDARNDFTEDFSSPLEDYEALE